MPVTITFTIPDAEAPHILAALCAKYGYQDRIVEDGAEIANPETRRAFVKRKIVEEWVELVARREAQAAAATAGDSARAAARGRIVIT